MNMALSGEQKDTALKLWLLLPRVGEALQYCFDLVFGKYGVSNEQTRLLAVIKYRGPLRPVDIALFLERAPNSMSMLVDRMVKAGLVRRTRDRKDRRGVFVSLTDKGNEAIGPAVRAGWEFINKFLSSVSYDDQRAMADTLETLKCELTSYLNPEMDKAEIAKNSFTRNMKLPRQMLDTLLALGYEPKLTRRERRKTVRRK